MIRFVNHPPVPGDAYPEPELQKFINEFGARTAGTAVASFVLAAVNRDPGLTNDICDRFAQDHVDNGPDDELGSRLGSFADGVRVVTGNWAGR